MFTANCDRWGFFSNSASFTLWEDGEALGSLDVNYKMVGEVVVGRETFPVQMSGTADTPWYSRYPRRFEARRWNGIACEAIQDPRDTYRISWPSENGTGRITLARDKEWTFERILRQRYFIYDDFSNPIGHISRPNRVLPGRVGEVSQPIEPIAKVLMIWLLVGDQLFRTTKK